MENLLSARNAPTQRDKSTLPPIRMSVASSIFLPSGVQILPDMRPPRCGPSKIQMIANPFGKTSNPNLGSITGLSPKGNPYFRSNPHAISPFREPACPGRPTNVNRDRTGHQSIHLLTALCKSLRPFSRTPCPLSWDHPQDMHLEGFPPLQPISRPDEPG